MFLNLIRDRLSEREQIIPGISLGYIVFVGDQVPPVVAREHIADCELPHELLCGLPLRLHLSIIASARIFTLYDPVRTLIV